MVTGDYGAMASMTWAANCGVKFIRTARVVRADVGHTVTVRHRCDGIAPRLALFSPSGWWIADLQTRKVKFAKRSLMLLIVLRKGLSSHLWMCAMRKEYQEATITPRGVEWDYLLLQAPAKGGRPRGDWTAQWIRSWGPAHAEDDCS